MVKDIASANLENYITKKSTIVFPIKSAYICGKNKFKFIV